MSLLDLARRLDTLPERAQRAAVHAFGEVIGAELLQWAEDHRDTGQLAATLEVTEQRGAVDFTSRYYRVFVPGPFRKGVPRDTLARARVAAAAAVHDEARK